MAQRIVSFTWQGVAVAKARPRVAIRGGFARAYTPKATMAFEAEINIASALAMREAGASMAVDEALICRILISRAPLKSWSKKMRAQMLGRLATGSADIDNKAKAILDGMNGTVYQDDRLIGSLTVTCRWAEEDSVSVEVLSEDAP